MEAGWIVSIVLGVIIAIIIVVIVVWVFMRRKQHKEDNFMGADSSETVTQHESHSISKETNDRWDALLKEWEKESKQKTSKMKR